jgi:biotin-(acetyl-CoA carboxylase) ligase
MAQFMGTGNKPPQVSAVEEMAGISRKMAELSERTRLLEERLKQTREKLQVVDETFMNKIKELKENFAAIGDELAGVRKNAEETREIVRQIARQTESTAKLSDVKVLEKYINMVDITRIITKEDVMRIVQDEIKKAHMKKKE